MYKVKQFYDLNPLFCVKRYEKWIEKNQGIEIIAVTTLAEKMLVVTYQEKL